MTSNRRKRILKALGCALIIVMVVGALLCGLSRVFYPKDNRESAGMDNEVANGVMGERENSLDVLFVGDSEAYSSFSPLYMWENHGFTSYVCASDAQQLTYSFTLLRRATQKQRPHVVVIEAHSAYNPFSPGDIIFRTAQDIFPIFEFHDRWKSLTPSDFTDEPSATYTDMAKGFHTHAGMLAADATDHMTPGTDTEPIPRMGKLYLQLMVSYCNSIGATPLLVSVPSTLCWSTERHNSMEAYARELGVTYIDLNAEPTKLTIDWATDTYDGGDHLNYIGAKKVSDFMGSHLTETYDLPDHRDQESYASWDEAAEQFAQKIRETQEARPRNKRHGQTPISSQKYRSSQSSNA